MRKNYDGRRKVRKEKAEEKEETNVDGGGRNVEHMRRDEDKGKEKEKQ